MCDNNTRYLLDVNHMPHIGPGALYALFQFICTTIYDEDAIVNLV